MISTDRREILKARTATTLVLLWAIVGPLRGYLVEAIREGSHTTAPQYRGAWAIAFIASTAVFIGLIALLKLRIEKLDGDGHRYWGWFCTGAALVMVRVCASHVYSGYLQGSPPWWLMIGILLPIYSVGMTLLLLTGVNADPLTIISQSRRCERPRDWARVRSLVPVIAGLVVLLTADFLFFPVGAHRDEVREDFFHEVLSLLPILLLALAFEMKFFRGRIDADGRPGGPDPVLRTAPIATGIMISLAIIMAGSTLTYDHSPGTAAWHVFIAFAISVQAVTTALATVLWVAFTTEE